MKRNWRLDSSVLRLIFIGFIFLIGFACNQGKEENHSHSNEESVYYCPMHPQIQQDHPGKCPICKMDLVLKQNQDTLNTVVNPVNETVISNLQTVKPVWKAMMLDYEAQGFIDYDRRREESISSLYSGRIEKLYIKYSYQPVKKGDKLFEVYSPELLTVQQNLVYLIENNPDAKDLINNTKEKLRLLGLTHAQVNEIVRSKKVLNSITVYSKYDGHVHAMNDNQSMNSKEMNSVTTSPLSIKEGMYIEKGQTIFQLVDPHELVAVLQIKSEDVGKIKIGQKVKMLIDKESADSIEGKIDFIEPVQNQSKTVRVRVYMENHSHKHKIGNLVQAKIHGETQESLWIPRSALLDLGKDKIVWVKQKGEFKARYVTTGVVTNDNVEIFDGLSEQDEIAREAHYLSDSENFISVERREKE